MYFIELCAYHFRPVVFAISGDVTFEANLVLATLASDVTAASLSGTISQPVTPGGLSNSQAYCNVRQTTAAMKRPTHSANDQTTARYVDKLSTVLECTDMVCEQSRYFSILVQRSTLLSFKQCRDVQILFVNSLITCTARYVWFQWNFQ